MWQPHESLRVQSNGSAMVWWLVEFMFTGRRRPEVVFLQLSWFLVKNVI